MKASTPAMAGSSPPPLVAGEMQTELAALSQELLVLGGSLTMANTLIELWGARRGPARRTSQTGSLISKGHCSRQTDRQTVPFTIENSERSIAPIHTQVGRVNTGEWCDGIHGNMSEATYYI